MRRTVYMIRHGATEANEQRLYYGATDLDLSQNGRDELLKRRDTDQYPSAEGCTVFTSGLARTVQTLEILYPGVYGNAEKELAEMSFGQFEMRSYDELKSDPDYQTWISGDFMVNVCPGGESGVSHGKRVTTAFSRIMSETDGDILMICHDGTIAAIMHHLFPDVGENRWHWRSLNGSGYAITFDDNVPGEYWRVPAENADN